MRGGFALPLVAEYPERLAGFVAVAPVGISRYKDWPGRVTAPVPAVRGEQDRTIPLEQADVLMGAVKHGRKVIVPGAGHAPWMNDPQTFSGELLRFLAELPRGRDGA